MLAFAYFYAVFFNCVKLKFGTPFIVYCNISEACYKYVYTFHVKLYQICLLFCLCVCKHDERDSTKEK